MKDEPIMTKMLALLFSFGVALTLSPSAPTYANDHLVTAGTATQGKLDIDSLPTHLARVLRLRAMISVFPLLKSVKMTSELFQELVRNPELRQTEKNSSKRRPIASDFVG
jgi:hypothetical protein